MLKLDECTKKNPKISERLQKMYYQRLRDIREDADKTQAEIAKILGLIQTTYSRYERGIVEFPMHHFKTLAKYYGISLEYLAGLIPTIRPLYGGTDAPSAPTSDPEIEKLLHAYQTAPDYIKNAIRELLRLPPTTTTTPSNSSKSTTISGNSGTVITNNSGNIHIK